MKYFFREEFNFSRKTLRGRHVRRQQSKKDLSPKSTSCRNRKIAIVRTMPPIVKNNDLVYSFSH